MVNWVRHIGLYCVFPLTGATDVSITVPVHCECLLLVHLHQQPAVPYIGVSKLSCGFCRMYFAAYREVTRVEFYARGSHGQMGPWALPVLGDATLQCSPLSPY